VRLVQTLVLRLCGKMKGYEEWIDNFLWTWSLLRLQVDSNYTSQLIQSKVVGVGKVVKCLRKLETGNGLFVLEMLVGTLYIVSNVYKLYQMY